MHEVIATFTENEFMRLRLAVMDRNDSLLSDKLDDIKSRNDIRLRADHYDLLDAIENADASAIRSADRNLIMAVHEEKLQQQRESNQ